MVSSTGEGEFTSVSLAAPSRAFAEYSGTLARASSIAHWQLRDLVCCVSNPSASAAAPASSAPTSSRSDAYDPQLFVVRHCSTLRYSLRDRKVRKITMMWYEARKARTTKENGAPEKRLSSPTHLSIRKKKNFTNIPLKEMTLYLLFNDKLKLREKERESAR